MWPYVLKLTHHALACQASPSSAILKNTITNHQLNARKTEPNHIGNEQITQNAKSTPNEQVKEATRIPKTKRQ